MILDFAAMVVCMAVLLLCVYAGYDTYMVYYHAADDSVLELRPEENGGLSEAEDVLGSGCVGWITLDGTGINYPVMQGSDNSTWLNQDPYGNFSLSGSIFLDARNEADFSDSYSLIYGHHMEQGVMFGALDEYLDADYLDAHRKGTLTAGDEMWEITLFAVCRTNASVQEIFEPAGKEDSRGNGKEPAAGDENEEFPKDEAGRPKRGNEDLLLWLKDHAELYEEPLSDHLIGLSTCAGSGLTDRLVVFGYLEESHE